MGILKFSSPDEVWNRLGEMEGAELPTDKPSNFVLERYMPGDVYHVDSLVVGGEVVFRNVARYGVPPFAVVNEGGVSTSHTLQRGCEEERALVELNARVLWTFGLSGGTTHVEFIRSGDDYYFLEAAARVGGAYTVETVEAASGLNMWLEWARIECSNEDRPYVLPEPRRDYGGVALSLARQESPDTSAYTDPEIVYRVSKSQHVGLVVTSPSYDRVVELLADYSRRFAEDFTAVAPPEGSPRQYL